MRLIPVRVKAQKPLGNVRRTSRFGFKTTVLVASIKDGDLPVKNRTFWSPQKSLVYSKKTSCFDATKTGGNVPRCPKKHPVVRHKLQSMVWKLC